MENPFEEIIARLERLENQLARIEILFAGVESQKINHSKWFSLNELVEYLPTHPAKATVYGWIHATKIPHSKKGKRLFFKKSEIDEWLQSGRRKTDIEIEREADDYLNNMAGRRRK